MNGITFKINQFHHLNLSVRLEITPLIINQSLIKKVMLIAIKNEIIFQKYN